MNKSERAVVIIFRVIGVIGLFAIPAIFLPHSWMNDIHDFVGLGELPEIPIVGYLTRSLSAFYAMISVLMLMMATDIRRYRPLVKLFAVIVTLFGIAQLGIDLHAGMPLDWTLSEGPPTIVIGVVVLWLQRNIGSCESNEGEKAQA